MFLEMGKATILIFLAELGDKTQILAMAFALQFSVRQVLTGVALGSFLNHGLAVIIGSYLAHVIPLSTIRLASALLFLGFGLWTLRSEKDEEHTTEKSFTNPILVVALAFFLGELGDKTQLTAIALASNALFPWAILIGTVIGMVVTSLVGIIVGTKLGERIPDFTLKLISSAVFIGFGLFHLAQTVPERFLSTRNVIMFLALLITLILLLIVPPIRARRGALATPGALKTLAGSLYALDQALNQLCLDDETCRGERCPVGYCKRLVKEELTGETSGRVRVTQPYLKRNQEFDVRRVNEVLELIENTNLEPTLYRELKTSLERLKR